MFGPVYIVSVDYLSGIASPLTEDTSMITVSSCGVKLLLFFLCSLVNKGFSMQFALHELRLRVSMLAEESTIAEFLLHF